MIRQWMSEQLVLLTESDLMAVMLGLIVVVSLIALWGHYTLYPIWMPREAKKTETSRLGGETGFFLGDIMKLFPFYLKRMNPLYVLPFDDVWRNVRNERIKTVSICLGPKYLPAFFLTITIDPVNVKHILKDNFDNYEKGELFFSVLSDLLGLGIFVADGPTWYRQRKVASKIFTKTNFNSMMMNTFNIHAHKLVSRLKFHGKTPEKVLDMQELYYETTMDAIMEIAFGYHIAENQERQKQFSASFDRAQALSVVRLIRAAGLWKVENFIAKSLQTIFGIKGKVAEQHVSSVEQVNIFNGVLNELNLMEDVKVVNNTAYDIIKARRSEESSKGRAASDDRTDVLSLFMGLTGEDEQTDEQLRDMVVSFIIAGRDTTASTLTWLSFELARNPDIEARIIEELVQTGLYKNKTASDDDLPYETLKKDLPYTTAVVHETIRLHSPVPLDFKVAAANDILPTGEYVQRGHAVAFSPWVQARDTEVWGEDAAKFVPDRWLPPRSLVPPTNYVFPSFQAGPRICLGRDFAVLEAKSIVVSLLSAGLRLRLEDPKYEPKIDFPTPVLKMAAGLRMKIVQASEMPVSDE